MNGTWIHQTIETLKTIEILKDQIQKINACSKTTVETLEQDVSYGLDTGVLKALWHSRNSGTQDTQPFKHSGTQSTWKFGRLKHRHFDHVC